MSITLLSKKSIAKKKMKFNSNIQGFQFKINHSKYLYKKQNEETHRSIYIERECTVSMRK